MLIQWPTSPEPRAFGDTCYPGMPHVALYVPERGWCRAEYLFRTTRVAVFNCRASWLESNARWEWRKLEFELTEAGNLRWGGRTVYVREWKEETPPWSA